MNAYGCHPSPGPRITVLVGELWSAYVKSSGATAQAVWGILSPLIDEARLGSEVGPETAEEARVPTEDPMIHASEVEHHDAEARLRARAPRLQAVVDEIREALESRPHMPGASRHALECVLVGLSHNLSRGWELSEDSAAEVRNLLARVGQ